MRRHEVNIELQAEATILSMPANLGISYLDSGVKAYGTLYADKIRPEILIAQINPEAAQQMTEYLSDIADSFPDEITFYYENSQCLIRIRTEGSHVGVMWSGNSFACLFAIKKNENAKIGTADYYISQVAAALGIDNVVLFCRRGSGISLPLLTKAVLGKEEAFRYPSSMEDCNVLFCGSFSYDKEKDLVGKFLDFAFGIGKTQLSLIMGMSDRGFEGYAMLPAVQGSVMSAEELYFGINCKAGMSMGLKGSFRFSFLTNALFYVDGTIGTQGFLLEAFAKLDKPVSIYKGFGIGDTTLCIGVSAGNISFRMFSNFYIGEIKSFGAIGLAVLPGTVKLEFLSIAITDITLSKLIRNIFGKDAAFANGLDFIELSGLPLVNVEKEILKIEKGEDVKDIKVIRRVADDFNKLIKSATFAVNADSIYMERIMGVTGDDYIILTDKSRMRHYCISSAGKLSLQAQVYYSALNIRLGDYTLKQGLFMCGSITLFHKFTFKALFSMSEEDGVIAYASIDKMNLGIISIGPSGIKTEDDPLSYFPKDSLLWTLMDNPQSTENDSCSPSLRQSGAVFFLRAGKTECSFYIDGKIILFGFFGIQARLYYTGKTISIDTRFSIGGMINAMFQLKASYADFADMNFSVQLIIDCTGLEKKLKAAQAGIEDAISKLREKMGKAQDELKQAQCNVNGLHSQIQTLDKHINDCKRTIRNAKWWKKAFVAVKEGIKIAAYEVAKAALYISIGVANAALELAKQAVGLAGVIGEGVLQAVKGAISVTLNLFFVKYVRLAAKASMEEQGFLAEIEFVALGKTFTLSKQIGAAEFLENPEGVIDTGISDNLKPELTNIEKGTFKSNRRKYKKMQCSMNDYRKMLGQGMEQLRSGTTLLQGMSEIYFDQTSEVPPELEEYNYSYAQALSEVESVLALAQNSVDFEKMDQTADMLKEVIEDPEKNIAKEKRETLNPAIQEYEAAVRLADKMQEEMEKIEKQRESVCNHPAELKARQKESSTQPKQATIPDEKIESVLNQTEELLYQTFPRTKGRGSYICLSREDKIVNSFDIMREKMGLKESDAVKKNKKKSSPVKYEQRL